MIVLDTNVISEMMKPLRSTYVVSWIDRENAANLYVTTITIAEVSYGLSALPAGSRRTSLENAFDKIIDEAFQNRVLPFDEQAAHAYGKLMSTRKAHGRPLSILDGQIAAIASQHRATLATRNTSDFVNCGLVLINPFEPA